MHHIHDLDVFNHTTQLSLSQGPSFSHSLGHKASTLCDLSKSLEPTLGDQDYSCFLALAPILTAPGPFPAADLQAWRRLGVWCGRRPSAVHRILSDIKSQILGCCYKRSQLAHQSVVAILLLLRILFP